MADCQAVVEIKNDLIRTMGECRDVTDQYQTGRSAYLRLGQLFMRLFAGLLYLTVCCTKKILHG